MSPPPLRVIARSATVAPLPEPDDSAIEYASSFVHATVSVPVAVSVELSTPAVPKLIFVDAIVQSLMTFALMVKLNVLFGVVSDAQADAISRYA
jgi:hypothetical protein